MRPIRSTLLALALLAQPLAGIAAPASTPAAETPAASEPSPATATAERKVEGTKLLFLRLNLRIKLIETQFTELTPEQFNDHLAVAGDLLQQLNDRPLKDDETARADRSAQYLQSLVGTWLQLKGAGAASP